MTTVKPSIELSWQQLLSEEFRSPQFLKLKQFLVEEKKNQEVYPPGPMIFNAFDHTPVAKVKVIIIGQDPYHGPGQANGLCFSVNKGIPVPPSLKNIFKELNADIGMVEPPDGDLTKWADEGVLLLNATLTVRKSTPGSHQGVGWEEFTDAAIQKLSQQRKNLVFLLWGKYAQNKAILISESNGHLVLKAPHPSPFSAHTGFLGCKHFSKTNLFLNEKGIASIDWNLNEQ